MIDLKNFQSINLSQFFDSVEFRSGSGYHSVIDFCIVMFSMLMILMKFSFFPKKFSEFFFLGSGFHYEIHWKKLLRKVFVRIKILFRIRIMILL